MSIVRALKAQSKNALKLPPTDFIPPNDSAKEVPKAVTTRDFLNDDEYDEEILISSDE